MNTIALLGLSLFAILVAVLWLRRWNRIEASELSVHGAPPQRVLELSLNGRYRHGLGDHLSTLIATILQQSKPNAVVLDFTGLRMPYLGDDLPGLVTVFYDRDTKKSRITAIIATGVTRKSLEALLSFTRS